MTDIDILCARAQELEQATEALHRDLNAHFKGRQVRITCPNFNGQVYGQSKPKLKDRVFAISWAAADRGRVFLGFAELDNSIPLSGVELLPSSHPTTGPSTGQADTTATPLKLPEPFPQGEPSALRLPVAAPVVSAASPEAPHGAGAEQRKEGL